MNAVLQSFVEARKGLFWSVGPTQLHRVSEILLVETILNYGSEEDDQLLFQLMGLEQAARIFFQSTRNRIRHNYLPQVQNYFNLYFQRHLKLDYAS